MYTDDGAKAVRTGRRPAIAKVLGAVVLLATVGAALASDGHHRAVTLLILFGGVTLAGCLFGVHVRNELAGSGTGRRDRSDGDADGRG